MLFLKLYGFKKHFLSHNPNANIEKKAILSLDLALGLQ